MLVLKEGGLVFASFGCKVSIGAERLNGKECGERAEEVVSMTEVHKIDRLSDIPKFLEREEFERMAASELERGVASRDL